ncbi:MAG: class I SAM-dependent methyltransferase [Nitrospira sp.]|nr:class I SAM-dependent methyltransferase [Nitrospira sp.]
MMELQDLLEKVAASLHRNGMDRVSRVPLDIQAREFLSEDRAHEQLAQIRQFVRLRADSKLLEIGSGYGLFVALCNHENACRAYGIEPGADAYMEAYHISLAVLDRYGVAHSHIRNAYGESIPFPDNTFDVVWSSNVLEHVADPGKVLAEAYRLLKPGGTAIIVVPNYGSFWEGHYGVVFPPYCPKWAFRIIVRLLGRDPSFVDTLQFVTYRKLKKWIEPFSGQIELVSTGQEIWEQRVRTLLFSEWAELKKLKYLLRWIHALRLVKPVIWVGRRLHWETPFVLVFRKLA